MKKSKDQNVQKFLDELEAHDQEKFAILEKARSLVLKEYSKITEEIKYGGILFSLKEPVGGLFVSKKHVSFEFSFGNEFKDPNKHLEGTGKFRRHLKLAERKDIKDKDVAFFVKQLG